VSETEVNSPTSAGTRLPIRYLLVGWLLVLSAVAYLDRTNISVAGIQIVREFGISNTQLGWLQSAFLIGYAGFQIPAGMLARRLGPRLVLMAGGIWWGVFTVLTAVVSPHAGHALLLLILVRFGLGAGESTMYPATSTFVERWFPVKERGKANGIIFAGVGLGSGLTAPLVAAIILHYGWRASFWFSATIGMLAGIVWYLLARDKPEQHPWVGDSERTLILTERRLSAKVASADDPASYGKHRIPWASVLRSRAILAMTLSYFSYGYVAWIFFAWMYIYMATVRGLNLKSSAIYASFPFIAMTVGCLMGGVISDWITARFGLRKGRCWLPTVALSCTAMLLLIGSRAHDARAAAVILALGAGVLYLAQSSFFAVSADIAGEYTGVVSGMVNMGGQIGGACTASLTPLIAKHFGWEMSFLTAAALCLCGGLAWLAVDPTRQMILTPPAATVDTPA
jgi:ACS family glucarate transporter-like MFS transporter